MKRYFVWILLILLQTSTICAQNKFIEATIIDLTTGQPIPFASVSIEGTSKGTAANEEGYFFLSFHPEDVDAIIHITNVGYRPLKIPIKEITQAGDQPFKIKLDQKVIILEEVTVNENLPDPNEIIRQVSQNVEKNYQQNPFNMEVFSTIVIQDSTSQKPYTLESILLTYRKGYTLTGQTETKLLEKRETGKNPVSTPDNPKQKQKALRPGFDLSLLDQIAVKTGYSVFNDDRRREMTLKYAGVTILDADTLCIIEYQLENYNSKASNPALRGRSGKLFVTFSSYAVVKHTMKMGTGIYEISYKKKGQLYYPYFMKSAFIFMGKNSYSVTNTMSVRDIRFKDVTIVDNSPKNWFPEDVKYDEGFWSKNFPKRK